MVSGLGATSHTCTPNCRWNQSQTSEAESDCLFHCPFKPPSFPSVPALSSSSSPCPSSSLIPTLSNMCSLALRLSVPGLADRPDPFTKCLPLPHPRSSTSSSSLHTPVIPRRPSIKMHFFSLRHVWYVCLRCGRLSVITPFFSPGEQIDEKGSLSICI